MPQSARTPTPPPPNRTVATAAIVRMVGKGMSVREIQRLLPDLTPEDIRAALLRAANVLRDENASVSDEDSFSQLVSDAQQSGLAEDEAMELALAETRDERAARKK